MVTVTLWGSLADLAGGQRELEVNASNLRELLTELQANHPALRPQLARGVSVSIDGKIYNDSWFQPILKQAKSSCSTASKAAKALSLFLSKNIPWGSGGAALPQRIGFSQSENSTPITAASHAAKALPRHNHPPPARCGSDNP